MKTISNLQVEIEKLHEKRAELIAQREQDQAAKERPLKQVEHDIRAAEEKLKSEQTREAIAEMNELDKVATAEGDAIAEDLISVIRNLEKMQNLFEQAINIRGVTRCPSLGMPAIPLIRYALTMLDGLVMISGNEKAKSALNEIETEGKYVRL